MVIHENEGRRSVESRPPDVFLIGVPRAATTALYFGLRRHPKIFAPDVKQPCFACSELDPGTRRDSTLWTSDAAEYLHLFAAAEPDQLSIDGCIYNVYSRSAPRVISGLNREARILIQLRDPVEQLYSSHSLKVIFGDSPADDFEAAIAEQDRRRGGRPLGSDPPENFTDYDMRDKAIVSHGLARFIATFGRDRVHVSLYEEFAADSAAVIGAVLEFLQLTPPLATPEVDVMIANRVARLSAVNRLLVSRRTISSAKRLIPRPLHPIAGRVASAAVLANRRVQPRRPLAPALRDRLRREFQPEVERLGELVGRDLIALWWGAAPPSAEF
jgi:hypothetical protein